MTTRALLVAAKELVAAEEEGQIRHNERTDHLVKRDILGRRLRAWGALHAAIAEAELEIVDEEVSGRLHS